MAELWEDRRVQVALLTPRGDIISEWFRPKTAARARALIAELYYFRSHTAPAALMVARRLSNLTDIRIIDPFVLYDLRNKERGSSGRTI